MENIYLYILKYSKNIFLRVNQEMPTYIIVNKEVNLYGHTRDSSVTFLLVLNVKTNWKMTTVHQNTCWVSTEGNIFHWKMAANCFPSPLRAGDFS